MAFNFINEFNKILNTKEKLFKYIQENNPEYFYKKRIYRSESSSSGKPKRKKKGLFVDTQENNLVIFWCSDKFFRIYLGDTSYL